MELLGHKFSLSVYVLPQWSVYVCMFFWEPTSLLRHTFLGLIGTIFRVESQLHIIPPVIECQHEIGIILQVEVKVFSM